MGNCPRCTPPLLDSSWSGFSNSVTKLNEDGIENGLQIISIVKHNISFSLTYCNKSSHAA